MSATWFCYIRIAASKKGMKIKMKSEKVILSPSMLSCNFARLEEDILKAEKAGCEYLHLDVMDGIFVPNIALVLALFPRLDPYPKWYLTFT